MVSYVAPKWVATLLTSTYALVIRPGNNDTNVREIAYSLAISEDSSEDGSKELLPGFN